jgi:Mor family transcriptional regulator
LDLVGTPLSKMYTKSQIRGMVNVGGEIYFLSVGKSIFKS